MAREKLYFVNFRARIGDVVTLTEYATPKARQAHGDYRRVPSLVYRLLRPFLRKELKTTRTY